MKTNESEKLQRKRKRAKNDAATAIRCLMQWAEEQRCWGTVASLEDALDDVQNAFEMLSAHQCLADGTVEPLTGEHVADIVANEPRTLEGDE